MLEAKGYITRRRSAEDARSLILALTEAGKQLKDAALFVPKEMGACLGLSEHEVETLYHLIFKVLTNVTKE